MIRKTYIGKEKWKFSDEIYYNLTGNKVTSNFNPKISMIIKELPGILSEKRLFGIFWSKPTFKDIECNYIFHVYDKINFDYIISTSSGNTVEGVARVIQNYNKMSNRNVNAILLVPELSSYKIDKKVIENNQNVKYIVLKNSDLDQVREFSTNLKEEMSKKYNIITADINIKTAAYAQIGLVLDEINFMNNDTCIVQTVSGGVGPAGVIEAAYKLKVNPELLVVQPLDGISAPIIDALEEYSKGKNPFSIFENKKYETPKIETTLGSTRPNYAISKFVDWRENGGRILGTHVTKSQILKNRDRVLNILIKSHIYQNKEIGLKLFDLEKSGFIALIGTIISENQIRSNNIIVNFTGRCLKTNTTLPKSALPHIKFNPTEGSSKLLKLLGL